MKQRVAVALAAVWLASIVGASVPSGETTAFSNPRPSGPSPDQYTPSLRKPRSYHRQDEEHRQDWMNDEPPRIRGVPDRREEFTNVKDLRRPGGSLPESDGRYGILGQRLSEILGTSTEERNPLELKDFEKIDDDELNSAEAMRLSTMKVAFDEPVVTDEFDEDWKGEGEDLEDEKTMRRYEFLADDPFEDEGPGSVEVYKLDLSIKRPSFGGAHQTPQRKPTVSNKSKVPKKVGTYDQTMFKTKAVEASESKITNEISKSSKLDEFSTSSGMSPKDRIFGVGGVPELQVGCEGNEVSERQKRSDFDGTAGSSVPVFIDPEYDSDEELDLTSDFVKVSDLQKTNATDHHSGRGDMDPRIKSPGELEARRLLRKDSFPTRGDLGTSGNPNVTEILELGRSPPQRRPSSSVKEENFETNTRGKRSVADWGYDEEEKRLAIRRNRRRKQRKWCKSNLDDPRCRYWKKKMARIKVKITGKDGKVVAPKKVRKGKGKNADFKRNLNAKGRRRKNKGNTYRVKPTPMQPHDNPPYESKNGTKYAKELERFKQQMKPILPPVNKKPSNVVNKFRGKNGDLTQNLNSKGQPRKSGENANRRWSQKSQQPDQQNVVKHAKDQERDKEQITSKPPTDNDKPLNDQPDMSENDMKYAIEQEKLRRQLEPISPPVNDKPSIVAMEQEKLRRQLEPISPPVNDKPSIVAVDKDNKPSELRLPNKIERVSQPRGVKKVPDDTDPKHLERLKTMPPKANIYIIDEKASETPPVITNRFNPEDLRGLAPAESGHPVKGFPTVYEPPVLVEGPPPCASAILRCCGKTNRLSRCFEAYGCEGVANWDSTACSSERVLASLEEIDAYDMKLKSQSSTA